MNSEHIKVKCLKNGAESSIFTDGKLYEARNLFKSVYEIFDDKGYPRLIIPNNLSPLLKKWHRIGENAVAGKIVGCFLIVEEQKDGD